MTEYRDIPGAPGYQITRDGRIRSWCKARQYGGAKDIATFTTAKGAKCARLYIEGRSVQRSVPKLVRLAWPKEDKFMDTIRAAVARAEKAVGRVKPNEA